MSSHHLGGHFAAFYGLKFEDVDGQANKRLKNEGMVMAPFPYIYHIPGTQMTPVLIGKGLLLEILEGSNPKIEDKQVPGIYYILP